ncbi:phenylalanine--tRNA ligase subunit beta [Heyndrickxia acidiproducens]|uniref:phenylalanine--tRNA ligase subunit beta n=1 Tax=Heyndrickxia acidiproducens TaxID=1121084 RepID=UPI000368B593|nr:phenylalanine--tRNA ligase subunit beta [Heyndrickxia acidiproducens]
MYVSYKWLQEYVELGGISPEDLAEKITRTGIEVESVEFKGEGIKNVVVGHVLEKEQHPNADKLNICRVDIGEEAPVQIICGAPNVAKGQKVAVAKPGAWLPGHVKIKRSKLRGEESNGMICSLQELGVESKLVQKEYANGIFVFPSDAEPGQDALPLLGLDDTIIELGLTPNRADCQSMLGVAYEVAAILGKDVKLPETDVREVADQAEDMISVRVDAKKAAPLYTLKVIRNVKIGPSPLWMQARLMAEGIRPHNNVVDITNYILLEYGQPLHAFDYDRLGSKEIVVRMAREGEKMVTLDDQERMLKSSHLVITNGTEPVAMAGVMGGANSEVSDSTTTVLLESAYFDGLTIRGASKDHGLRSEASARYERGIDPNRVHPAAERAAALMARYAGGEVLSGTVEVNNLQIEPAVITITLGKINRVLGTRITEEEVLDIFKRLQFDASYENGQFTVVVPTRRGDITIEEDLIEEVVRLYGYDRLPLTLPAGAGTKGGLTEIQQKRRVTKQFMEAAGLFQAVTYSLTSEDKAQQYALEKREPVRLAMPMSEERSVLRLSILPHLLESVAYNVARKNDSVALYEVGTIFLKRQDGKQPEEQEHLAGAITGLWEANLWQGEKKAVDFFVAKGILEGFFEKLGVAEAVSYRAQAIDGLHPGRTAEILLAGSVIGFVGQVHPNVQKELDMKETYVFELNLEPVYDYPAEPVQYRPIPRFPAVTRDIALVVDRDVEAGKLQAIIEEAGGALLKSVSIFDLYEGEHMEPGKKSLAFSLTYFDPERTLTDEEVVAQHDKVLTAVKEKAGAELRG